MIHIIWEKTDGSVIKGLKDCASPSPTTKELVDSDLNHGVLTPGATSAPQVITLRTFSWSRNGDPVNPITDVGFFLAAYYASDPVYTADGGFTYCGGASSATFGDYTDANGSHSAGQDLAALQGFGDASTGGVQISTDLGRSYTTFSNSVGTLANPIQLAATAMDIGTVNGQLDPGDRASLYLRIKIPTTYTDPANQGVWLFNIGAFYSYTE
jgi:hypothetical protein